MNADWLNAVPAAVDGKTAVSMALWQLLQDNIPVLITTVDTVLNGAIVTLPAAFQAAIALGTVDNYRVLLTKQSFNEAGGEVYVLDADKTLASFIVRNSGSEYGEKVFVVVFWVR